LREASKGIHELDHLAERPTPYVKAGLHFLIDVPLENQ
jgi:hypothetical protein